MLFMERNAKTIVSDKEQNSNKQMPEFETSIFFPYFMCISAKSNVRFASERNRSKEKYSTPLKLDHHGWQERYFIVMYSK